MIIFYKPNLNARNKDGINNNNCNNNIQKKRGEKQKKVETNNNNNENVKLKITVKCTERKSGKNKIRNVL